ncbi:hypothetical protein J8273_0741 [Carpediemonas membranifera]|uniref:Uncharacterized protein n=1 Tax=Carpediemonas membranifera TaxID=201153 RepID=A0A8J6C1I3_9EUKA|nr:hypothetical protein J8273_0741 [Carpediemonas membranifera]|eukprot:KAG9397611.1 hypothetical protein J8273_0741 [Carpediemonas membranifera]
MSQQYIDAGSFSFFFELSAWPLEHLYNNFLLATFTNNATLTLLLAYIWESVETFGFSVMALFDPATEFELIGDSIIGDIWSAVLAILVVKFIAWRTNNYKRRQWGFIDSIKIITKYIIHHPISAVVMGVSLMIGRVTFWVIPTSGDTRLWALLFHYLADSLTMFVMVFACGGLFAHNLRRAFYSVIFLTLWHIATYQIAMAYVSCILASIVGVGAILALELFVPPIRRKVKEREDPSAAKRNNDSFKMERMLKRLGRWVARDKITQAQLEQWMARNDSISQLTTTLGDVKKRVNSDDTEIIIDSSFAVSSYPTTLTATQSALPSPSNSDGDGEGEAHSPRLSSDDECFGGGNTLPAPLSVDVAGLSPAPPHMAVVVEAEPSGFMSVDDDVPPTPKEIGPSQLLKQRL